PPAVAPLTAPAPENSGSSGASCLPMMRIFSHSPGAASVRVSASSRAACRNWSLLPHTKNTSSSFSLRSRRAGSRAMAMRIRSAAWSYRPYAMWKSASASGSPWSRLIAVSLLIVSSLATRLAVAAAGAAPAGRRGRGWRGLGWGCFGRGRRDRGGGRRGLLGCQLRLQMRQIRVLQLQQPFGFGELPLQVVHAALELPDFRARGGSGGGAYGRRLRRGHQLQPPGPLARGRRRGTGAPRRVL